MEGFACYHTLSLPNQPQNMLFKALHIIEPILKAVREEGYTIPTPIQGFRGYRYRSWDRAEEMPFPEWQTDGVVPQ